VICGRTTTLDLSPDAYPPVRNDPRHVTYGVRVAVLADRDLSLESHRELDGGGTYVGDGHTLDQQIQVPVPLGEHAVDMQDVAEDVVGVPRDTVADLRTGDAKTLGPGAKTGDEIIYLHCGRLSSIVWRDLVSPTQSGLT
jgi:hypothetical protein